MFDTKSVREAMRDEIREKSRLVRWHARQPSRYTTEDTKCDRRYRSAIAARVNREDTALIAFARALGYTV
jgi:hypothetical protein